MSDVTVITCWNNEEVYNDFVNTLKSQTYPCEIIGIDNRGNKGFTSCAAAYNSVIDRVKTKYVIYSHQDILLEDDVLAKFVGYLERLGRDDILGAAGVTFAKIGILSNIKQIINETGETLDAGSQHVEGGLMECDTLDECFFGGYTEHFRENPFNEKLCNGWHLYAVDACLNTKSKSLANRVYVCGVDLLHRSSGNPTLGFYYGFFRLCRHYADSFPFIRTTVDASGTSLYRATRHFVGVSYIMCFKLRIKRFIESRFGRK